MSAGCTLRAGRIKEEGKRPCCDQPATHLKPRGVVGVELRVGAPWARRLADLVLRDGSELLGARRQVEAIARRLVRAAVVVQDAHKLDELSARWRERGSLRRVGLTRLALQQWEHVLSGIITSGDYLVLDLTLVSDAIRALRFRLVPASSIQKPWLDFRSRGEISMVVLNHKS